MSNLSSDPFAPSACLAKGPREYRGHLQYCWQNAFEGLQRHVKEEVVCRAIGILANLLLAVTLVASAQAQTEVVPVV